MSSLFDSEVYQRRNATVCTRISLRELMETLAVEGTAGEVSVSVCRRPAVASRFWWSLRWKDAQGTNRLAEGQTLDLALWRAATILHHDLDRRSRGRETDSSS